MFMCQRDAFLTQFEAEVTSWTEFEGAPLKDLCKTLAIEEPQGGKLFEVILSDTILFPEGGGQPDDHGFIDKFSVVRVIRKETQALHYVVPRSDGINGTSEVQSASHLKPGDKVLIHLDWKRRFDHMQQHSGQHLVTSITDQLYGYPTTAWWLGTEDTHIEIDTPSITDEQMKVIEEKVNDKIRENVPLTVEVVDVEDPKLKTARGLWELPDDIKGQVRIITMKDIESTVCCGTNVTCLAQLQVIKLLYWEKKRGKVLLHFLCGDRVLNRLSDTLQREQKLGVALKTAPVNFVLNADKLNLALKNARKSCQSLTKDLAALEAKKMLSGENAGKILWHSFRENIELDFGTKLLFELGAVKDAIILVLMKATEGSNGNLLLRGGEDVISSDLLLQLGEKLCELLDGKGTVRGNVFQAKVNKATGIIKALKLANEFIHKNNIGVKSEA